MPFSIVLQQHETGCGLACLAMLAGKDYPSMYRQFASKIRAIYGGRSLAIDDETMHEFCEEIGVALGEDTDFSDWTMLRNRGFSALVAIHPKPLRDRSWSWHWVVYDGERDIVLDPYPKIARHERRDYGRMRPFFYASVHRQ
ncbi:hypothetical protein ACSSZE_18440 [Acidithiobacillus caldus]